MNIGILTHNISAISQQRFAKAAAALGQKIRFIHLSYCYTNVSDNPAIVRYRENETVQDLDAILPRIPSRHHFYGSAVLRQFERSGIYVINTANAITLAFDKLRSLQHLANYKLPMPITGFADSPQETEKLVALVGGAPIIVRLLEGEDAEGRGTVFAETHQAAISVINAFKQLKVKIIIQEYIKDYAGSDIRCVVIGDEVIGAIQRSAKEAGFRARYRFLTHSHPIKLSEEETKLAIAVAKAMNLNFATVDFIRSHRGPLILDVDPTPNIEALEKITKVDIATPLLSFIMQNTNAKQNAKKETSNHAINQTTNHNENNSSHKDE